MKVTRITNLSKSSIAVAVGFAIANSAFANTIPVTRSESVSVSTKRLPSEKTQSVSTVSSFSEKVTSQMNTQTSRKYMENEHFADASTFPMRIVNKLNDNPWRTAPNLPIAAKDLACFYGVPSYRDPVDYDVNTTPVTVTADSVSGNLLDKATQKLVYKGNVVIEQGDKKIKSDKAIYSGKDKTITTVGDTSEFSAAEYTVTTPDKVVSHLDEKVVELGYSRFVLNGAMLNGTALKHVLDNKNGTKTFEKATLSTCPIDKRSWHLSSSSVTMKKGDSFGDAWNDVLYIGKVPVFYTPYANFPITNKRRSGLLVPSAGFSTSKGISYAQPIYLNLATNYDATIVPEYDPDHHDMISGEFRYLPLKNISGYIKGTYISNDPSWETQSSDKTRWFVNIKQDAWFFDHDLNVNINYSKVRNDDYTYISDVSQKAIDISDSSLLQSLKVSYAQTHYDLSYEMRKYQNMYTTTNYTSFRPFAMMPQVKASWYNVHNSFSYTIDTEATNFNLDKMRYNKQVNAQRFHVQPKINYHVYDSYGTTFDLGLTGYLTQYAQSDLQYMPASYAQKMGYSSYSNNITRALYQFEAGAKTTLERKVLDMNHTQTLEPEIKYQYVPYKNQDDIALYDTTERYDDYYTLFSSQRFAGIDRIAVLNSITVGLTSRILDVHDRETFRFSVAQAYDFVEQRVRIDSTDDHPKQHRSPIEARVDAMPTEGLSIHTAARYDPLDSKIYNFNTSLKYTDNSGFSAGTSYRFYRKGNYLIENQERADLHQIGFEMNLPLSPRWRLFGATYRELEQSYNIDTKVGLKYDDCCYTVTFLYEDYMKMNWNKMKHKQNKLFGVQFELKGLFEMGVSGIADPNGTSTHYIPSLDLSNLNR
ncbi:MAG: LPS assembly protein LptD [Aeromonadales bacterium]|nr:LPS assembly protein LptD [Aeromonadales bacterium]